MKFDGKNLEMYFDGEIDDFVGSALIAVYNDLATRKKFNMADILFEMEIVGFTWERDDDAMDFFDNWVENETTLVESTGDGEFVFTDDMCDYIVIRKYMN